MTDIASLGDDLTEEQKAKYKEDFLAAAENSVLEIQKNLNLARSSLYRSLPSVNIHAADYRGNSQLDRLEEKVDRILEILEKK